jgi:hypothetical protein
MGSICAFGALEWRQRAAVRIGAVEVYTNDAGVFLLRMRKDAPVSIAMVMPGQKVPSKRGVTSQAAAYGRPWMIQGLGEPLLLHATVWQQ